MSSSMEPVATDDRHGALLSPSSPSPGELRARLSGVTLRDEHRLRRRLQGTERDDERALARISQEIARAEERVQRRRSRVPPIAYPPALPVSGRRDELLAAIREHQVVIVAGETGSGKTTQLPKLCLELGRGVRGAIAHTQPRRLAARTVAERIAEELEVEVGDAVGYAVRFSDRSSEDTLVRLLTDGLLLAEIQHDRLLRRYDTIIIDEAHERSLNVDFLLGYLKQILPRRPDLKVIITSATIEPERFSRHFGDAPVIEVSGRTYPVEVRYRPLMEPETGGEGAFGEAADTIDAIGDAVEELFREGPGGVLVFLSGEREIRDAADALTGRLASHVEVLPLYARLSASEQQKVFRPVSERRVILASNVAETSLTVPGIRYVVDAGTARMSRYSARLKVQRLPIEPISQASADQRKGRCGRTSDGICIRLYDEQDFAERPRYTDPEILRTNLASVVLQMAALGLGVVEAFPFLDPPDARQIRDGLALLRELGAFEPSGADADRRLTPLGRRLARLPVDPRMARMVLEADSRGCADEVIVIAAALSIQDPRERPADRRQAADELHARFSDEHSDFLAYLNLWRYLQEQQRGLSRSQFRRQCRREHLHHLRVREWQDLAGQLRQAAEGVGVRVNQAPAAPEQVHTALLAGLLSHIGLRDARRRDYQGARGARFAVFPGSALARRQPDWVMVAELVETSRLWGRTAARIRPSWIEPLAGHMVKRSHAEPHWERRRASAVAVESVTLYGLPIVTGRKVLYGAVDPQLARELFIRRALVEGDWNARHAFLDDNRKLLAEVEELEHRVRRRGIVADQALFDFYDARVPTGVVSGAAFDAWWKQERRVRPDLLTFDRDLLIDADAAVEVDAGAWPEFWRQGELTLALSYRFDPGSPQDGVTVHVPLAALGSLTPDGFDWLVPALRRELVTTLIRHLPKELRRRLVPVPDVVAEVMRGLRPEGPLLTALAAELERRRGVRVPPEAWDVSRLPAHLRMTFRVEDARGAVLASGNDLAALRARLRPRLRAELDDAAAGLVRTGLRDWTIGELPRSVAPSSTGDAGRGYPALVDEGDSVAVRVLDTPAAQAAAMPAGTRRLLSLSSPPVVRQVGDRLSTEARLALLSAPHGSVRAVLEDCMAAAVDALVVAAGGPAWDAQNFRRLRDHVAARLPPATERVVGQVVGILAAAREVERRLESLTAASLQPARRDLEAQLGRLVHPGFVSEAGAGRLDDIGRYLQAALRRVDRLPAAAATDADRMRSVHALEQAHRSRLEAWPAGEAVPESLREVRWLLEELRISHFAQGLGTRGPVSSKRIRRLLEDATATGAPLA